MGRLAGNRRGWQAGRRCRAGIVAAAAAVGINGWGGGSGTAVAQVMLDGSLGPARSLPPGKMTVPYTDGRLVDKNLFHSFGALNLAPGDELTFTGPDTVSRVWARVTGGSPSTI